MVKIEKILVPTDFSEASKHALEYALDFSRKYDAKLCLLHVVEEMGIAGSYVPHLSVDKMEKEMFDGAGKMMADFCSWHLKGITNYEAETVIGYPHIEILKKCEEKGADLIIMGSHGRSGIERVFFGSVAEKVVKKASCPVLTVRKAEELKEVLY